MKVILKSFKEEKIHNRTTEQQNVSNKKPYKWWKPQNLRGGAREREIRLGFDEGETKVYQDLKETENEYHQQQFPFYNDRIHVLGPPLD